MRISQITVLAAAVIFIFGVKPACADWLSALQSASQQMQNASQQMEQRAQNASSGGGQNLAPTPTTNPIKGTWGNQVSCAGPNTATCQNGMDNLVNCMHQSQGYYYRLVEDKLQTKLKNGGGSMSEEDRKGLQADIVAVHAAIDTGRITSDPQHPNRWIEWLNKDDQMQINQVNIKYINEVHADCDKRFGGM